MSAEDYHDVPGLGGMSGIWNTGSIKPKFYQCNRCRYPITFKNKKPFNEDGTPHRCMNNSKPPESATPQQAVLFAMAAMNAIINGQIQAAGVDHIHQMSFSDVADASWRMAAEMVQAEKNYRHEFGRES